MEKRPIIFLSVPASLKDDLRHFARGRSLRGGDGASGEEAEADFPPADDLPAEEKPETPVFEVDPSIPLPAEFESGGTSLDPDKLSWEMILSGMLRIIAGKKSRPAEPGKKPAETAFRSGETIGEGDIPRIPPAWVDYYRRFVLTVRPEIYHEFSGACIVKAENGEFDMALEISAVLEGLFPSSPGVLLNKALLLEDRAAALEKGGRPAEKENTEALEAWETALSMGQVLEDIYFNAGFFFMRLRDFARARECFSLYIRAGEEPELASGIPGEKKEQAERIIRDISAQGLDDPLYREAYEHITRGNDEKALPKIREFIEDHPKVWNGWFMLGWTLRKLGRWEDGLAALKKAVDLGGGNSDVRNETAICLMELGDIPGARAELEHALREEPENTRIVSNLGVLAMKTGDRETAAAFFRTVLELDPADPLAKHFLAEAE